MFSPSLLSSIKILQGDITTIQADAIVNAANTSLLGGGGVDGAIHRAAGPELLQACKKLNGCKTGYAKMTPGFRLPAKYIIHTVGPIWHSGNNKEAALLASCYKQCFHLAAQNDISTVAFPNISTGVYRFPKALAAQIAIETTQNALENNAAIMEVIFVCFDAENLEIYNRLLHS